MEQVQPFIRGYLTGQNRVTGNTVLDALSAVARIQKTEDRKKDLVKYYKE